MLIRCIEPVNKSLCLEHLCASNYHKLLRLIPALPHLEQTAAGIACGKPDLQFIVLEKAPYTLTLQLSHRFEMQQKVPLFEPALKIRVYLDVQLAEVLRDHVRSDVASAVKPPRKNREIMDYKWTLNYFLQKWLDHCLQMRYRFYVYTAESAEA